LERDLRHQGRCAGAWHGTAKDKEFKARVAGGFMPCSVRELLDRWRRELAPQRDGGQRDFNRLLAIEQRLDDMGLADLQLSSPNRWRLCAALDWATGFHPQVTPGRASVGDPENRIQSAPVVAWRTTTQSTGRNDKRREEGHSSALRNLRTKAEFPRKHQLRITAHCVGGILIQRIVHAT
jgi:hypothetical protein